MVQLGLSMHPLLEARALVGAMLQMAPEPWMTTPVDGTYDKA